MDTIICGTTILLFASFKDANGDPYDPTEVTGKIRLPDDSVDTFVPTRDDTGEYSSPFTPTLNGLHVYRIEGDTDDPAVLNTATEGSFMAQTEFPT